MDRMIKVIFDSNIFFDLANRKTSSGGPFDGIAIDDFCRLRDDNELVPYFTLPNFIEYLMGVNSEHLESHVNAAQVFSKVTCGGSILEAPLQLVRRECAIFVAGKYVPPSDSTLDNITKIPWVMRKLSMAKNWDEVKIEIESIQAAIKTFKSRRNESYEKLAKKTFKLSKSDRVKMVNHWPKAFVSMMKQLKIPEEILTLETKTVFEKIFSLRYRFATFWGCASRKLLNGEQMLFADYGDIDQGCYLSIADYWVTNDRRAKLNLVEAEKIGLLSQNEVSPRILNWDEFITLLVKRELKRGIAPCNTRSVKYIRRGDGTIELVPY